MTPDQEKKLDRLIEEHAEAKIARLEMKQQITEIKHVLVGNKELETKGIVQDVRELKEYKEKDQNMEAKILGGAAVVTSVISVIGTWIWNKFFTD